MLSSDFCGQAQNSCFARERKLDIVAQDPWDGGVWDLKMEHN